ncbi:MAG: hypothetical protein C0601_08345 [Candidatus Muiribacterium halophilum]|uniref:Uncharacterized protein n=1 Tax=Muiribacterium halophilum TaxID=2053465 RepID=A0A2N5ZEQ4_MUIH1|nr:MAG: hypothetical protein C0601_08345 [Candidatus Muirbacterium halophilum]
MPLSFISRLFDDNIFFPMELDDINYPAILSNYFPKYSNNSNFEYFVYYDFKEKGGIYLLFLSDSIQRETRFYYYKDPLESLQSFYVQEKELINKNTPVILFSDLSYQNFRKVSERADFVDYIINFQDFEQGDIFGKKIRNIKKDSNILYKMDILFGNHGFLTFDFYEIPLEKIDSSLFMKRVIDTRRFSVDEK